MSELEAAIEAIKHLFEADRYPSYKTEFDLISKAALNWDDKRNRRTSPIMISFEDLADFKVDELCEPAPRKSKNTDAK